jgi:glycosyltransferase involved in cell wall biosynthesis
MRLILVSTYPPRRCGLAAFSQDLRHALLGEQPDWEIDVAAVDRDGLRYGPEVVTVIDQDDPRAYRRAARDLSTADVVLIQHEYGIFGGPDGSFVLELAGELRSRRVPYVVTLHTVLAQPTRGQEATLAALCRDAARITVFSRDGARLAVETGIAEPSRVSVVPHGAPPLLRQSVRAEDLGPTVTRTLIDLGDTGPVLATFGFVGPGKGLHDGIAALPHILARHPDVRYLIAGTTHPEEARRRGDAYRNRLAALADELGVADRVSFINEFVTVPELAALLGRTDLYLTPYPSADQICSGALTFALAAGRPVVSTAYRYAVELLTPHGSVAPGVVVPCEDVGAIASAVTTLLSDPQRLTAAREAADRLGKTLMWPAVASRFAVVCAAAAGTRAVAYSTQSPRVPLCLNHIDRLTDEIGILQFGRGTVPDPGSGYCVDDMARLGVVAVDLASVVPPGDPRPRSWLAQTLRFVSAAAGAGGMHNQLDYGGSWCDQPHLGDHIGRSVWALGSAIGSLDLGHASRSRARALLADIAPLLAGGCAVRTLAYAILGLVRCPPGPEFDDWLYSCAARLARASHDRPLWHWYEATLSYDNARLPQALLAAGGRLTDEHMVRRGLSTLEWYLTQVGLGDPAPAVLRLVGNGWRRAEPSVAGVGEGDEQPLDAAALVEALVQAWQLTRDRRYASLARRAFAWFHGANRAAVAVYDPAIGGCRDGLSATGASDNEGAESTLAYHQANLTLIRSGLAGGTEHGKGEGRPCVPGRSRGSSTSFSSAIPPIPSSRQPTGPIR